MRSIYTKLSLALLAIIVVLGMVFVLIERNSSRLYYEELTQRLNSPIATYVVGERQLIHAGEVDTEALQQLAHQAMILNPSVEVYLVDTNGRILAHALDPQSVRLRQIDLEPVRAVVQESRRMPLKGDDPRNPGVRKVFSAAAVTDEGELQGYLYAVLGGAKYDAIARDIAGSHVQRLTLVAVVMLGLTGFVVGLLLFAVLTRRLRRLTATVQDFAKNDFSGSATLASEFRGNDEIDRLARVFERMSCRIAEQMELLQQNDKLRRELVANVSHDLRTPLASAQGYIETLLIKDDRLGAAERREYLAIARKHAARLGTLIGDLFELSKLDAHSVEPQPEWFSLAELLQDVVQEFQLDAEAKGISLVLAAASEASPVLADIGLIQRVLENLIKNALQFTPSGGEIRIEVSRKPATMAVAVEDTGSGIRERDIPRIFDRLYRAGNGEESRSSSSGLGLAIVKRILDLHQSRITVSSRANLGTRFEFELPTETRAA